MKNVKTYNIFMFISTFTRNIIDIYSVIYLYKIFKDIKDIFLIYILVYFLGSIVSTISLKLGNKYGYKYILMLSQIVTSLTFYLIKNSTNIYLIALSLSISIFTYHPVKHYYGIIFLKEKTSLGKSLIIVYLSSFMASFFVIKDINFIYLFIISLCGIIPCLFLKKEKRVDINYQNVFIKNKLGFFIFDQAKIIFLLLEPLYLYLGDKSLSYVSIFNIIITISSVIYLYVIANKYKVENKYFIINILFVIVLVLKLEVNNYYLLLFIAFLEGIGIKTNELISTLNLYQDVSCNNRLGYLIISEIIFCITRGLILLVGYFLNITLNKFMYLLLIGVFILSFMYKKKEDKCLLS